MFFDQSNPVETIHGNADPLEDFKTLHPPLDSKEPVTRDFVFEKFHKGLRLKEYKSITDLRDEYQDDYKALAIISKNEKTLEDFVD